MKIQIQLDSQCEEPEILIRTAAVTAEIRELVEKLSEKRSDSVVGYDADSAVLLEKSQIIRIYGASRKSMPRHRRENSVCGSGSMNWNSCWTKKPLSASPNPRSSTCTLSGGWISALPVRSACS